jgi:hypothetical protein
LQIISERVNGLILRKMKRNFNVFMRGRKVKDPEDLEELSRLFDEFRKWFREEISKFGRNPLLKFRIFAKWVQNIKEDEST